MKLRLSLKMACRISNKSNNQLKLLKYNNSTSAIQIVSLDKFLQNHNSDIIVVKDKIRNAEFIVK